jgi:hypothetical protein
MIIIENLILVQNEELLNAFMEVDRMSGEDQKIVLELIKAFIAKRNSLK